MHIEIFRDSPDSTLKAIITQWEESDDHPSSYASDQDYMIFFDDKRSVVLDMISYGNRFDSFDVYIDGDLSRRCMIYKRDGILVHIFKENDLIRIAESSDSMCLPVKRSRYNNRRRQARHTSSPLRLSHVLRSDLP